MAFINHSMIELWTKLEEYYLNGDWRAELMHIYSLWVFLTCILCVQVTAKFVHNILQFNRGKSDHRVGHALESSSLHSWSFGILWQWRPFIVPWSQRLQGSIWWGISTSPFLMNTTLSMCFMQMMYKYSSPKFIFYFKFFLTLKFEYLIGIVGWWSSAFMLWLDEK